MSLLLLAALTMQADAPAPTPAPPTTTEEKKTCRRTQATLSRVGPRRVCHTAAEWAEIDRNATTDIDSIKGQARTF